MNDSKSVADRAAEATILRLTKELDEMRANSDRIGDSLATLFRQLVEVHQLPRCPRCGAEAVDIGSDGRCSFCRPYVLTDPDADGCDGVGDEWCEHCRCDPCQCDRLYEEWRDRQDDDRAADAGDRRMEMDRDFPEVPR